jgi:hypothetical protein
VVDGSQKPLLNVGETENTGVYVYYSKKAKAL